MRERPILFSPWSVQRILANAKTQTRRVVGGEQPRIVDIEPKYEKWTWGFWHDDYFPNGKVVRCPHGEPGDVLWVKEPFSLGKAQDGRTPAEAWEHVKETKQGLTVLYRAGGWKSVAPFERYEPAYKGDEPMPDWAGRPRHGMFMPRWASRITLEIADIRVQRVQEISSEDCIAEGCVPFYTHKKCDEEFCPVHHKERAEYKKIWDEINGKTHPWSSDPYVWAISFRRLDPQ